MAEMYTSVSRESANAQPCTFPKPVLAQRPCHMRGEVWSNSGLYTLPSLLYITWDASTLVTDILWHMRPSWHRVVYFGNPSLIYTWRIYLLWGQFTLFILAIGNWWFVSYRFKCFAFHIRTVLFLQIYQISNHIFVVYSYIQCDLCCKESAWLFLLRKPNLKDSY